MSFFRVFDSGIYLFQKPVLIFSENAFQDQLVGRVVASENSRFQFKRVNELPYFLKTLILRHPDELSLISLLVTILTVRKIQDKRRQKFRLGLVFF